MQRSGKLLLAVFAVILILAGAYRLVFRPLGSQLNNTDWCVDHIYYKGRSIEPHTLHAIYFVIKGKKTCTNKISFMDQGDVQLPGINSRAIDGGWQIDKDKHLQLTTDTIQDIYQGTYEVGISGDSLVLKSKTTVVVAHR